MMIMCLHKECADSGCDHLASLLVWARHLLEQCCHGRCFAAQCRFIHMPAGLDGICSPQARRANRYVAAVGGGEKVKRFATFAQVWNGLPWRKLLLLLRRGGRAADDAQAPHKLAEEVCPLDLTSPATPLFSLPRNPGWQSSMEPASHPSLAV